MFGIITVLGFIFFGYICYGVIKSQEEERKAEEAIQKYQMDKLIAQARRETEDNILADIICQNLVDKEEIILYIEKKAECSIIKWSDIQNVYGNRISKIVRNENEEPYLEVKPTEINGQYYIVTDTKVYRYLSEHEKTKKLYK